MIADTPALARLTQLIAYVAATERDRLAVPTEVAAEKGFRAGGSELMKLPGVALNGGGEGDPLWISVDRLARTKPARIADLELAVWTALEDDPDKRPTLKAEAPVAALSAAGLSDGQGLDGSITVRLADYARAERVKAALDAFVREVWTPWADEERPRRRAIKLYNDLFALRQTLDGGSDLPLELVCGIGIADWKRQLGRLHYPLLTVQLEIAINEDSHAIELRPRSEAPPGLESDPLDKLDAPNVDEWRRFAQSQLDGMESGLSPFDPSGFAPILRKAVALLDPSGHYLPELHPAQQPPADSLTVSDGWIIFARGRRATQVMADLVRLSDAVAAIEDAAALPEAVRAIVTGPSEAVPEDAIKAFRGVSTVPGVTTSDGTGADLYLPKPFNAEQVEVIQRLEQRPGVVVQGPPGTGKTHTIANIVSHYLALGKRVLVTSQKAPALKVVRDKLPAGVRPLAVSLLESDREGLQQFQDSVDEIASRLQRLKPREVKGRIAELDSRIELIHVELAGVDRQVDQLGRAALSSVELDGRRMQPVEAARALAAAGDLANWLPDPIDVIRSHDSGFGDDDIARLREARKRVGGQLTYLSATIPSVESLPSAETVEQLHRDLSEAEEIERGLTAEERLADGVDAQALALVKARLEALLKARSDAAEHGLRWTDQAFAQLRRSRRDAALEALEGLHDRIEALGAEARHFLTRPVTLPDKSEDREFRDPVANLAVRGELGIFTAWFQREVKQRIAAVRVAGRAPAGAEDWAEVKRYLEAGDTARELIAAWNNASTATLLDTVPDVGLRSADAMKAQLEALSQIRAALAIEADAQVALKALLPHWTRPLADSAEQVLALLDRHLRRMRLASAQAEASAARAALVDLPGELGGRMRALAYDRLGGAGQDPDELARDWRLLLEELAAIRALGPAFAAIRAVAGEIEESGAPLWARSLRELPIESVEDPLTPGDWRERWRLRRLTTWLDRADASSRIRGLARRRSDLETQLARAYEDVIELRTWCALAEQATDQVRSALSSYAQAMRRIGRGTGVRAARYRNDARAAADRAKNALPCWIMPHYRVSESLPAELGLFDLVIVDEASQSTISALPALLRAKQVLIVGDDKQVSPDAGFRSEEKLVELARRHLAGQVDDFRAALREDKSLYDLGSVVFAGGAIMLKEHFRCVAPVIEFSKAQFYDHKLQPLRLPAASERLDPPLIDILVEDGARVGDVNRAEIACILDEIARIVADPLMGKRTIGVTTLLGQKQALLMHEAIETEIGPEAMLRHHIRVGDPSAFQGDERDIMFLSLVASGDRPSALSGLGFEQRFNVAASRARDRMVLVRSVEPDQLSPADKLRRALIQHFRAPFAADTKLNADRRARCDSPFEEALFDRLAERGYRVDTQVPVGTKRIDLVVEGGEDRRLAIECDGDAFHGPDRWPEDMARQRMLERAGWTVWRCFASRFVRDPDGVLHQLVDTLDALGIAPTSEDAPPSRFTEQRVWRAVYEEEAGDPIPYAWLTPADPFDTDLPVAAE
jgi:very-short-patch-repair endonuclease